MLSSITPNDCPILTVGYVEVENILHGSDAPPSSSHRFFLPQSYANSDSQQPTQWPFLARVKSTFLAVVFWNAKRPAPISAEAQLGVNSGAARTAR